MQLQGDRKIHLGLYRVRQKLVDMCQKLVYTQNEHFFIHFLVIKNNVNTEIISDIQTFPLPHLCSPVDDSEYSTLNNPFQHCWHSF